MAIDINNVVYIWSCVSTFPAIGGLSCPYSGISFNASYRTRILSIDATNFFI